MPFATLRERDRWLYIVHEMPMYDEPILVRSWYPIKFRIAPSDMDMWQSSIGQELREWNNGMYVGMKDGRKYQLPEGGQTKAEFTEREPIPRPRGKTLRYQYGRWERYTQARGWEVS